MLILSGADLVRALPMGPLVDALAAAFIEAAEGHAVVPTRIGVPVVEQDALLAVMPAYLARSGALATKVNTLFRKNPAAGRPLIQGIVLLCDGETGKPLALFESGSLTARRTAAGAAVATRALAREDAGILALIGAGIEARTHLEAIAQVRPLREVRVCARTLESAERFATTVGGGLPVRAVGSPREAVEGADLVVTVSTSAEPVISADWIAEGAHICGVGSHSPGARELDGATVARAAVIAVDTMDGCRAEAGDLLIPIKDGLLTWERVRLLGDVLRGAAAGRDGGGDVTLYKSVGTGVMDAAAARMAYAQATALGLGTTVDF